MKILVERFDSGTKDTLGRFYIDGKRYAFCLEDEKREVKVKGDTRIPEGEYEVKFNKAETPLTLKYRNKYDWFTFHLEVCNVPNFKCIYIHMGNTEDHTEGCLILGDKIGTIGDKRAVLDSAPAFKKSYLKISEALNKGEKVFIKYFVS